MLQRDVIKPKPKVGIDPMRGGFDSTRRAQPHSGCHQHASDSDLLPVAERWHHINMSGDQNLKSADVRNVDSLTNPNLNKVIINMHLNLN